MKKKSPPLSLEERKERSNAMLDRLQALPLSKYSLFYEDHALEKTLQRLKAFLRFLTALNPKQYLAWMMKAFSHIAPTTLSTTPVETYTTEEAPVSLEKESAAPAAGRREKKPDRKRVLTPG